MQALSLQPGATLDGRYVVRGHLGDGGMSCVFLADQPALARTVAIKLLRPELASSPMQAERLRGEALAACRVRNPHCVAVIDCGALSDGAPYLVMEHVRGRSLGRIIAEESIPLARAVDLLDQILSALAATHDSGVVHGDVKSDNFLVEQLGDREHVTLIDFGLAHLAGSGSQDGGDREDGDVMVSGTPEYMAPEVVFGEPATCASDLYGAGVILYELVTGSLPFPGGTAMEIMLRQAHDVVVPPSRRRPDRDVSPALDRVVLRALDKRPEARFPDAATFARELRAAIAPPHARGDHAARSADPAGARRNVAAPVPVRRGNDALPAPVRGSNHGAATPTRLARGSDCGNVDSLADLHALRRAIGQAVARGDVAEIANGYLALASALSRQHRRAAAAFELQEGIDVVTAGRGPGALDAPHAVDQLVVALAALYEGSGDRQLARSVAASADQCPTMTDHCPTLTYRARC
ncbi:MAG TPA: serine/threonine-protein kinase [Kofleriaceae bacterium]|nr:serine/threonine-protein kinase [Kofleriaceae bacterium]